MIDYRRINECIKRPHWNFLSFDQVRKSLPGKGGYIITCDLKMGFHQIHFPGESRDLTRFSCEYGKYRWKRYPQGLSSSGDIFNMHVDVAMHQVPKSWYCKCVDDILIIGKDKQECFERFEAICKILEKYGMVASLSKLKEGKEVEYCGYIIKVTIEAGPVTISPSKEKVNALIDIPQPQTKTQLKRFLGLINPLCNYLPNIIPTMASLSAMTSNNAQWVWLPIHTHEFNKVKEICSNAISLTTFDFSRQTSIETDASKVGVDYMLKQTDDKGKSYIINIGSTSLKLKHSLLAPIDLEGIGMILAIKKLDYFIRGCPKVELVTDCKGIVTTVGKPLGYITNHRLQRLFILLSNINYTIRHAPGKFIKIVDCLSRAPLKSTNFIHDEISKIFRVTDVTEQIDDLDEIENCDLTLLQNYIRKDTDYLSIIEAIKKHMTPVDLPNSHPAK